MFSLADDSCLGATRFLIGHVTHDLETGGAMNNVFAGEAGNVGTGTSDISALDNNDTLSSFGHRPGKVLAAFTTAPNDDIVLFRTRYALAMVAERLGRTEVFDAFMRNPFKRCEPNSWTGIAPTCVSNTRVSRTVVGPGDSVFARASSRERSQQLYTPEM
jgi:hypothetical protein